MHDLTTRDLTNARSPASPTRFIICVGDAVDETLFNVNFSLPNHCRRLSIEPLLQRYISYVDGNVANTRREVGPHNTTRRHVQVIGVVRVTADTLYFIIFEDFHPLY